MSSSPENNENFASTAEYTNSFPYNMQRNYIYAGNFMTPVPHDLIRNHIPSEVNPEGNNGTLKISDDAPASDNACIYRRIVFIPVPAYYGTYPGYFSNDVPQSFSFP